MIELKKPTLTELAGLSLGVIGLVGVTFFSDRLINLLGGLTEEQAAEKYALISKQTSPGYRFHRFHGLRLPTCQNAVFEAITLFDQSPEVWPNESGRYGLMFEIQTSDGQTISANAGCFRFRLTEYPSDIETIIMITAIGNLDRDVTSENVDRVSESILANFDEDDFVDNRVISPFKYRLSDDRFVVKRTYLEKDIVVDGLEEIIPTGPISELKLDAGVKAYWCYMELEGLSSRYSEEFSSGTVPASEEDCYIFLE